MANFGAVFLPALALYLAVTQFGWATESLYAALAVCLSLLIHEAAHIAVARWQGVKVKKIGFSALGPYIQRERGTPAVDMAISAAGPAMNLLVAILLWKHQPLLHWTAEINALLGLSNLLPFKGSDGWNIATNLKALAKRRTERLQSA